MGEISDEKLQQLLGALRDTRARVKELEQGRRSTTSIVGIGARYPGDANDVSSTRTMFQSNQETVCEVDEARLRLWRETFPGFVENDITSPRAGFLRESKLDAFEPAFFGIHPEEAAHMDPQQRLLLEVAAEAFADAGLVAAELRNSRCGVFVGIMSDDYGERTLRGRDRESIHGYSFLGNTYSVAAGRLAYVFGLMGPAVAIDTACSSSLVAVHLASRALERGDCDIAIAGGVNLIVSPTLTMMMSRVGGLSADGRCHTFDARANGYVRGEGCGLVVMMREMDARTRGMRSYGTILGSAVNQDGPSSSLTAPSGIAQEALIRAALVDAGLAPNDVTLVEAHGTGTPIGDPIEANSIRAAYCSDRKSPLLVSSAKTALGHLESAAGIAGFTKMLLQLQGREVFPHLNYHSRNPRIDWTESEVHIPVKLEPWESSRRIGAVSSFGMSGTNAHVIVEEAPALPELTARDPSLTGTYLPLALSARTVEALRGNTEKLHAFLEKTESETYDIAYTSLCRRTQMEERLVVWGRDKAEWRDALSAYLAGRAHAYVSHGRALSRPARVGLLFSGQGSQWAGMGSGLRAVVPVFAESLAVTESTATQVSLRAGMETGRGLSGTDVAQVAIYGMQVGLYRGLVAAGVKAVAVTGHSVGEIAACVASGALTESDATRLVEERGQSMTQLNGAGGMLALELPPGGLEAAAREYDLDIGAYNARTSGTLSGAREALAKAEAGLTARGVSVRQLRVECAFHSRQVDALQAGFRSRVGSLTVSTCSIPQIATGVEGERVGASAFDLSYWSSQMRSPVRFQAAVTLMSEQGVNVFVEVGPHAVVSGYVEETLEKSPEEGGYRVVATGKRDDDVGSFLRSLGALHAAGVELSWEQMLGGRGRVRSLPTYAWQRKRYWIDAPKRAGASAEREHPILHRSVELAEGELSWVFSGELSLEDPAHCYLADHLVKGAVWLPGAAFVEIALHAGKRIHGAQFDGLAEVTFERPLVLQPGVIVSLQLLVGKSQQNGRLPYAIVSRSVGGPGAEAEWVRHGEGQLVALSDAPVLSQNRETLAALRARCTNVVLSAVLYEKVAGRGIAYGTTFQGLVSVQVDGSNTEALGQLRAVSEWCNAVDGYTVHPAVLDVSLHAAFARELETTRTHVPVRIARVSLAAHTRGVSNVSRVAWSHVSPSVVGTCITLLDAEGAALLIAEGVETAEAKDASLDYVYRLSWDAVALPIVSSPSALADVRVLLVGGEALASTALTRALQEAGVEVESQLVLAETRAGWARRIVSSFGGQGPTMLVYASPLEMPQGTTVAELETSWHIGCEALVELVQGLEDAKRAPRLFALTRGTYGSSPTHAAGGIVWGALATIGLEQEKLRPKLIDTDGDTSLVDWAAVARELLSEDAEGRVALRAASASVSSQRTICRQKRTRMERRELALSPTQTYVVTGGTRGLGLALAERLVLRGAKHLSLVSRSGVGDAASEATVAAMRTSGCDVRVYKGDVASEADVARIVSEVKARQPPVDGVIHAAGVIDDGLLGNQTRQRMHAVMAPKVLGGALWLQAFSSASWVVHTTSMSGVNGNTGQVAYSAANAYLDAQATKGGRMSLLAVQSVLTVAFGAVATGMASPLNAQLRLEDGVFLTIDEAAIALECAITNGTAIVVQGARKVVKSVEGNSLVFLENLIKLLPDERVINLRKWMLEALTALSTKPQTDLMLPLAAWGLDSLALANIRAKVRETLGVRISLASFQTLSVGEIASELARSIEPKQVTTAPIQAPKVAADDTLPEDASVAGRLRRKLQVKKGSS
jgi:acyl transferase domain-containing protein